jgi:ABC-type nitrate/sulfonate/bicarbonate transport system substrate-binding protein
MKTLRVALFGLIAVSVLLLGACGWGESASSGTSGTPTAPEKVTFMAGFKAQANLPFVGVYVAKEKGFFKGEGLDVSIQHSSGGSQHVQLLMAGQVQFTTADAANVLQRIAEPGLPLLAVALIGQTGQQGWVTLADSGLDDPADWRGKTVGYRNTIPPDLLAILAARGLTLDDVNAVNIGYEPPQLLVEGRVDVYPTVAHFLAAVIRGIEWARHNRDEAVDIVLEYAPGEDREHQRFMLDTELAAADSSVTRAHGLGWQTSEQWNALKTSLEEYDAISGNVDADSAFSDRLLTAAYDELARP